MNPSAKTLALFPVHLSKTVLALVFWLSGATAQPKKPNVIIFMADDMGIGDTSAYLGINLMLNTKAIAKTLKTPHIEKFAKQGMVFTDAHAPASMCSSTRYSLLTGRLSHRSYLKKQGWLPHGPNRPMIHRALTTLPEMLKRNGYATAAIGKYHVGMDFDDGYGEPANEFDFQDVDFTKPILDGPTHHGFDEFFGVPGNTEDPLDTEPRIYLRNDRWSFSDRSKMKLIGMKHREGRILAAPDWDLAQLGPDYLREATAFVKRQVKAQTPFFLYYVPNANHLQQNSTGPYAVPESIAGTPIKGQSIYSDGSKGGDREDMVLENDVAFGILLKTLRETDDPRSPGHKLIDNTLVIFTSDNGPNVGDNNGPNQESGGLRGKKAKIWEGGHRVPFILYWKGNFVGGQINRNLFSLTDLFATLARLVGEELTPAEAQDSLDSLAYWKAPGKSDPRARYFFCHLGPPYGNDAIAIRKGSKKLIVQGGLARPWAEPGTRGASESVVLHDLSKKPYEEGDFSGKDGSAEAIKMAKGLLKVHNQGHSRVLNPKDNGGLILDDGWHNLRNDLTGSIGYEFELLENRGVTHLGMWDDHDREMPIRSARGIPTEHERDQPSRVGKNPRTLKGSHLITLWKFKGATPIQIIRMQVEPGKPGELDGEFRYLKLAQPVELRKGTRYLLTMTTQAGDGDHFHDPAAYDGLSPLINPTVRIVRSVLFRNGNIGRTLAIPAFEDLHSDHSAFRIPVGPTLRFQ
jgi:arylsulfatase A